MMSKNADFIKQIRELGIKVQDSSSIYSSNLYTDKLRLEDFNLNKDTKVTTLKYKNKIGKSLSKELKEILSREGEMVLLDANAGGGKTFGTMQTTYGIILEQEKSLAKLKKAIIKEIKNESLKINAEKVAYVLTVPTTAQAIQNEVSEDLSQFHYTKMVGQAHGEQSDINEDIPLYTPVYDSTLKVVKDLKQQGYKVKLIVDESHKMIGDVGFRFKALYEMEEAIKLADLVVMMTATNRKCLNAYEFNEIFKLVDTDLKNNIKDFKVVYTNNWEITLINKIIKLISEGFIPLVRLNSKKDITSISETLKKEYDIDSKELSSDTKDDEIFISIQENGTVGEKLQVLFCTSVIECGISLKQDNITPIEVIREASDFNKDDTIQFFARPRVKVEKGFMIIKNYRYVNPNGKSIVELKDFNYYFINIADKVMKQYNDIMSEVNNDLIEYGFEYAKEQLKARMALMDKNRHIINVYDVNWSNLMVHINKKKVINRIYSEMDTDIIIKSPLMFRECFKDSIFYDNISVETEQHYKNFADLLENGLNFKIEGAYDETLTELVYHSLNGKVLIGEGAEDYLDDIEVQVYKALLSLNNKEDGLVNVVNDIYDSSEAIKIAKLLKSYEKYDVIKAYVSDLMQKQAIKEERKKFNKLTKEKELEYRTYLEDKNFIKALPAIVKQEIDSKNIKDYHLKQKLSDIIDFRESELCEVLVECSAVFNTETAIKILTNHKTNKKGVRTYISYQSIRKMCRIKYFLSKDKKNIEFGDDVFDFIARIVESKRKNGKQINLTNSLGIMLITELVRNKYYTSGKGIKELKEVIKSIELDELLVKSNGLDYDFYSKENIKKLETGISSGMKNKLLKDLGYIYRVGQDSKGYTVINSFVKTFDLNEYLNNSN